MRVDSISGTDHMSNARMQVPLLDLRQQLRQIREPLRIAIDEVVDSTRYIGGPKVEELEQAIAHVATRRGSEEPRLTPSWVPGTSVSSRNRHDSPRQLVNS